MRHHAFAIEAEGENGIRMALELVGRELPSFAKGYGGQAGLRANPDIVVLKYGLFTVEDARRVAEIASQGPVAGESKVIIIAASRAYREAQNALLKLFEEPPSGTYLFLILPSLGGLLPTLKSRVQVLSPLDVGSPTSHTFYIQEIAEEFLKGGREKRSAIVKKLVTGRDEEERREHRDGALAIVNGIEVAAYEKGIERHKVLLAEIGTLRGYLHDRSAPVRMILEHLAIITPRDLV